MTLLLDIIFQSGDFYNQDNSWFFDLLNTTIGTVIGSAVTVFTLYLTIRYDKNKEAKKQTQFQKEKIKYLRSLVDNIMEQLKTQIGYYKDYAEVIEKNPINLPLLKLVPLNDLERVVHRINQEDYYHAYLCEFGDKQDIINEFRSIVSYFDYFEGKLMMDKSSLQKSREFDHERKMKLKSIIEKVSGDIVAVIINSEVKQREYQFWNFLYESKKEFDSKKTAESDLNFWHENLIEVIKHRLPEFAESIFPAQELIFQTRDATILYNDIQTLNRLVAKDFNKDHSKMIEYYEKLKPLTNRLNHYK